MKVADDKACGQAGNGWSDTLQRTDPVRTAQTGYDRFGPKPAFVKDAGAQRFFVRGGASSQELQGASITEYVKQRFR